MPWKKWQSENRNALFPARSPDSLLQRISLLPRRGADLLYEILFAATAPLANAVIHVGNDGWGRFGDYWLDQHLRIYALPIDPRFELQIIQSRLIDAWSKGPGLVDSTADWGTAEALLDTVDIGDYKFGRLVVVGVADFSGWKRPLIYELYSLREEQVRWLLIFVGCPSCDGDIRREYFTLSGDVLATLRRRE